MSDRPNILIFMSDQQRGASVLGEALMPNVEKFKKEGLTFTQAHCPSPHCCPSRASFFSGLMPSQHQVWHNVEVTNAITTGLAEGVETWSESLKESGYDLFYSGKWHVSATETPGDRGFQPAGEKPFRRNDLENLKGRNQRLWEGYKNKDWASEEQQKRKRAEIHRPGYGKYTHYGINENPFNDQKVVSESIDRLKSLQGNSDPWCMYVGTLGPHDPYFVPQEFLDMYPIESVELPASYMDDFSQRPNLYKRTRDRFAQLSDKEHKESIQHYLAFCTYEDHLFGKLLEALDEQGDAENTLVIYLSDHGDYMAEHGLWCKGLPCFKGAYHIPCLMRWPKGIQSPGREVHEFVGLQDFAPTFTDLAKSRPLNHLSGSSLLPFMNNDQKEEWRKEYYTQSNGNELYGIQRSVTNADFKLVYNGFDYDELYDLQNDPEEMINLINSPEHKTIIKSLYKKLWQHAMEHDDTCINAYIIVALAEYGPGAAFFQD